MDQLGYREGAAIEVDAWHEPRHGARFPTTAWTELADASLGGNAKSRAALEQICRRYWPPVYHFIRRRHFSDAEAEDLTQEFFLHLFDKRLFSRADRVRGRFRSFLLGALTRFLGDERDRRRALRRGGGVEHVDVDQADFVLPAPGASERAALAFDHEWACAILETALRRLREGFAAAGEEHLVVGLKSFLPGAVETPSYDEAAVQLGLSVPALKSALHRMRRRFRALVRDEIAQTVSAPHEIEAEMAHLRAVLMERTSDFSGESET
jgi:RNA polymerase sigma factor (sigma-70 family)